LELDPENYHSIGNKCMALKNLGRFDEAKEILTKTLAKTKDDYLKASYLAILEEKDKMLKQLATAIKKDRYSLAGAKVDPDFAAYRSDPEFRKLVYHERKERGNSQQTSISKS
jgi:tetratricopeptide (TPR) repeat protein